MLRIYLLPFLFCLASLKSNADPFSSPQKGNPNTIAVYNIDSVVVKMPEYAQAKKKFYEYDSLLQKEDSLMHAQYLKKVRDYYLDSAKVSPLIRQLEEEDLKELFLRTKEFDEYMQEDLEKKKQEFLTPLYEKAKNAAGESAKEKGYLAVIVITGYVEHKYFIGGPDDGLFEIYNPYPEIVNNKISDPVFYTDPKIMVVNITCDVKDKLGIQK